MACRGEAGTRKPLHLPGTLQESSCKRAYCNEFQCKKKRLRVKWLGRVGHNSACRIQPSVSLGTQVIYLLLIALPVACVSWTVTHEDIFRELREYVSRRSQQDSRLLVRKFFYIFTCEYCFSHYVAIFFLLITHFHLIFQDWRGTLIAFFSLPYVANMYMGLFAQTKLEAKKDHVSAKVIQEELEIKQIEKQCKQIDRDQKDKEQPRITPAA